MTVLSFVTRHAAAQLLPSRYYQRRATVQAAPEPRNGARHRMPVCLTFDDGPHLERTPRVLDQLSALDAKATFFLIGGSAEQCPDLVRRIVSAGHSIGSHTHCHVRATRMSADDYLVDAMRGKRILEDLTGVECPLFRPPHGELTPLSLMKLLANGMRVVHWTHEPKDTESSRCLKMNEWFQSHRPTPRAVVLLHDVCRVTSKHLTEFIGSWRDEVRFCGMSREGECQ
jgi:peptidoglycan-N-acetylglucosamine deacetylase